MGPVLGLEILLRVPVAIEQDDSVCCCEINAEAAGPGTKEEDLVIFVRIEGFDGFLSFVRGNTAVDAADGPAAEGRCPFFEDVELFGKLREDYDLVVGFLQGKEVGKEAVEHDHFTGRRNKGFIRVRGAPWPCEMMGRIAGEAELHYRVLKFLRSNLFTCLLR